jgi:hypothetical protein
MKQGVIRFRRIPTPGFPAIFLASGTFVILLLSPNLLGSRFGPLATLTIYLAPWACMWVVLGRYPLVDRNHRVEVALVIVLLLLGALNVVFSRNPSNSLRPVVIFLCTGVLVFWTAMFLFRDVATVRIFDLFCSVCFALVIITEVAAHCAVVGAVWCKTGFLVGNPIPTGGLLIVLLPGPFAFLASESTRIKAAGLALVASGLVFAGLMGKRGTLLACFAMFVIWVVYKRSRLGYVIVGSAIAAALIIAPMDMSPFKRLDPRIPSQYSILHRLEQYPFAMHVFWKHPITGSGLRSHSHTEFLEDYRQRNRELTIFEAEVRRIETFDNMLLTSVAELGSLFTLAYSALMGYVGLAFIGSFRASGAEERSRIYRVLPLLGFALHSMTYDSLMFPSVNWLFHAHLGILAAVPRVDGAFLGLIGTSRTAARSRADAGLPRSAP